MAEMNLDIMVKVDGTKTASAEIRSVGTAASGVGKQTEETSKKTSNFRKTLGTLATGFAVYKGAQFIKNAVTETTALAKSTMGLSRITGMDAKTAGGWVLIAKERGVQSKALNMGFITLAKNTQQLAAGNKTAGETFSKLGINAQSFLRMNTEQRMEAIADSFSKMKDPTERAAIAQKLFGRQAQTMLPLLVRGKAALAAQVAEMGKSSGMTNSSVKEQLKLVAAQRQMNAAMVQLKGAIAVALVPILLSLAQAFAPITKAFAALMQKSPLLRGLIVALTVALVAYVVVMRLATAANIAWMASGGWIIALVAGLVVAIVLLYQKCAWFRAAVSAVMNAVKAAFLWVKEAAVNVFNWIKAHWPLLLAIIGGPIGAAAALVITHWKQIRGVAEGVFNAIKGVVETVAKAIMSTLGGAFNFVKGIVEKILEVVNKIIGAAGKVGDVIGKIGHAGGGVLSTVTGGLLQHGGYMSAPGTVLVGEHGPETLTLPGGAKVTPFNQTYGREGGGGGNVEVPVYLDRRQIALAMGSYTADQNAAAGR